MRKLRALKLFISIQVFNKDLRWLGFLGRFRKSSLIWKRRKPAAARTFVPHLSARCQSKTVVTSCGATHPCSNTFHLFPPPLCIRSQGGSSQGRLLHLPTSTWDCCGAPLSSWQPLSQTPVRFPPHSPRKPFLDRKAKIKDGFVFRFWKWTHLHCPLILTSSAHYFINIKSADIWICWDLYPCCPMRFNASWTSIHPYASPRDKNQSQSTTRRLTDNHFTKLFSRGKCLQNISQT